MTDRWILAGWDRVRHDPPTYRKQAPLGMRYAVVSVSNPSHAVTFLGSSIPGCLDGQIRTAERVLEEGGHVDP